MQLSIDAEFKQLIPALSEEEYQQLEQNIITEGCRDALVVWQDHNTLIDGHNRYEICTRHNLPYRTIERAFDSREDVIVWIIQNQFGRRNLTPFVRSELALKMKAAVAAKAKANQQAAGGDRRSDDAKPLPQNSAEAIETRQELAKAADVSHDTIRKVETVTKEAPEPIKAKARSGNISVNRAYHLTQALKQSPVEHQARIMELCEDNDEKVHILNRLYKSMGSEETNGTFEEIMRTGGFHYGADMHNWCNFEAANVETIQRALKSVADYHKHLERERRTAELHAAAEVKNAPQDIKPTVYKTGDIVEINGHVLICNDNTAPMVREYLQSITRPALAFCDPPYNASAADYDDGTFTWSQDYLIDCAVAVAVTPGIGNIWGFMRNTEMPYRWSTSTYIKNGMTRGALGFGNWMYTALFSKSSLHKSRQDVYEITINQSDAHTLGAKRQKPPMYLSWLFELLTERGDTIIDAFGGSGTSVLVADKLGRRCICIEKDEDTFNQMVARIQSALVEEAA